MRMSAKEILFERYVCESSNLLRRSRLSLTLRYTSSKILPSSKAVAACENVVNVSFAEWWATMFCRCWWTYAAMRDARHFRLAVQYDWTQHNVGMNIFHCTDE